MFDLFRSSDKIKKYVLGGLLTLVALSMVTYLIPNYSLGTTPTDNPVLAEIGGKKITALEAQQLFQKTTQGRIPPDLVEVYLPQFVEQMVSERAALYEADRLGISATDDEALSSIVANYPQFFPNGSLANKDQFETALAQQGLTLQDVVDAARDQVILHKMQAAVLGSVVVTPKDIEDEFRRKYEKLKIQYIAFPAAKFRDQAKPSDEEVRSYYEKNKGSFAQPSKMAYQVVVLDQDKVAASINVTDEQLRAAYSNALDNFRMPERVHARHILLKTAGKSDAEKKALQAKAEDLVKQLKNGADFAELAKKYSEDGSKDQGGDLGWFTHGQMVAEFDNAAFALKPKEISGVVTSQFGYHIIQTLEKDPAKLKPFEEVKDELAKEVRAQAVTEKMQTLGDQMHADLVKSPKSAADVAKKYGADLIVMPSAAAGDAIPGLGANPEIDSALAAMKPDEVSSEIVLPNNREAVVILNSRTPGRPSELSEVQAQIRDKLTNEKAATLAADRSREAAERLKKGEDIAQVAKSMQLEVTTSSTFGRADSVDGLGPAASIEDAFNKPVGGVVGPTPIQGRNIVAKITEKSDADMAALPVEHDSILAQLKQKKAQDRNALLMDGILAKLTSEGKVTVNQKEIQNMLASLRQK
ncbi:MAG TPA: peptidyl-prolyl cis-trans isomerase [Bryobacteraceae bacterium]|jgi:peptidyl-prolyl cis-trans isomerase D|nr:peptidyl-prolyl cis-trans isomerase [Bryobacteraceae bacterium]